jgi:hypothetical protein
MIVNFCGSSTFLRGKRQSFLTPHILPISVHRRGGADRAPSGKSKVLIHAYTVADRAAFFTKNLGRIWGECYCRESREWARMAS